MHGFDMPRVHVKGNYSKTRSPSLTLLLAVYKLTARSIFWALKGQTNSILMTTSLFFSSYFIFFICLISLRPLAREQVSWTRNMSDGFTSCSSEMKKFMIWYCSANLLLWLVWHVCVYYSSRFITRGKKIYNGDLKNI